MKPGTMKCPSRLTRISRGAVSRGPLTKSTIRLVFDDERLAVATRSGSTRLAPARKLRRDSELASVGGRTVTANTPGVSSILRPRSGSAGRRGGRSSDRSAWRSSRISAGSSGAEQTMTPGLEAMGNRRSSQKSRSSVMSVRPNSSAQPEVLGVAGAPQPSSSRTKSTSQPSSCRMNVTTPAGRFASTYTRGAAARSVAIGRSCSAKVPMRNLEISESEI